MKEVFDTLVKVLSEAGLEAEGEEAYPGAMFGQLTVAGASFRLTSNWRGSVRIDWSSRFRRAKVSGYNYRKMVEYIITNLPHKLQESEKKRSEEGYKQLAKELMTTLQSDDRFYVDYHNGNFRVTFSQPEYHVLGIAVDFLMELTGEDQSLVEREERPAERVQREYTDQDGMVRSLQNLIRAYSFTDEEVDRIASMIVGEVFVSDDLRVERTQ